MLRFARVAQRCGAEIVAKGVSPKDYNKQPLDDIATERVKDYGRISARRADPAVSLPASYNGKDVVSSHNFYLRERSTHSQCFIRQVPLGT